MPAVKKPRPPVEIADHMPGGMVDCIVSRGVGLAVLNASKSSARRREASDPLFPKLRRLGPRLTGYVASELFLYVRSLPAVPADQPTKARAARAAKRRAAAAHAH